MPVDKQQVDWSELENQLFQPNPKGVDTSEDPLESFGLDFMQQIRQAEEGLSRKMKNYQEMNASLRLPQQTTLKKTNSRKVQIELMKDWNQVELEKQDGLRREFTKALFKKKK